MTGRESWWIALGYTVMFLGQVTSVNVGTALFIVGLIVASIAARRLAGGYHARGGGVLGPVAFGIAVAFFVMLLGSWGRWVHFHEGSWNGFRTHWWMLLVAYVLAVAGTSGTVVAWARALAKAGVE